MSTRWWHWARFRLAHYITLPIHHLSRRYPRYEFGLEKFHFSRIECRHQALAGRRAVQISDLHVDHYLPRHDRAIEAIAALKPDWIFITGDLLNVPQGLPHLSRFLANLADVAPVYLTLGNHDHLSGVPVNQFCEMADRNKVSLLINQTTIVPHPSGELAIVGVDDPATDRADLGCIPGAAPNRFTVVLVHAPILLDHLDEDHAIDLVLCGHTHGGQWYVPRVRPFWLPPGCNGRVHGEYFRNGHRLYVNKGLGWTALPIRINCQPEILVIDWMGEGNMESHPPE